MHNNQKPFYTYWDIEGNGISQEYINTYKDSLIFDTYNRAIWAQGNVFGSHYPSSYHGEIFNDYENNQPNGRYSSALGTHTVTYTEGELSIGTYNLRIPSEEMLFTVGNGTSQELRSNLLELYKDPRFGLYIHSNISCEYDIHGKDVFAEGALYSLKDAGTRISYLDNTLVSAYTDLFTYTTNTYNDIVTYVGSTYDNITGYIANTYDNLYNYVNSYVATTYDNLYTYAHSYVADTYNSINVYIDSYVADTYNSINVYIDSYVADTYNDIVTYVASTYNSINNYVNSYVGSTYDNITGYIANTYDNLYNYVNSYVATTYDNLYTYAHSYVADTYNDIVTYVADTYNDIVTYVGSTYDNLTGYIANTYDNLTGYIANTYDNLYTYINSYVANTYNLLDFTKINSSEKGIANGVATLDADGLVPSSQLPSFVDDVLEYSTYSGFPATGETGKIYVATDTNLTYRWSGTQYTEISASLALGETESTAFPGNRGKAIEDKVANIESGAQVNVQSDWNVSDISSDSYIQNKPDIDGMIASYGSTLHQSISEEINSYGSTLFEDVKSYVSSTYNSINEHIDSYVGGAYDSLYNDILAIPTGGASSRDVAESITPNETGLTPGSLVYTYVETAYESLYNTLNAYGSILHQNISEEIASYGSTLHQNITEEIASYGATSYESLYNDILAITPGDPNVKSDWNESNIHSDAYILNKPELGNIVTYNIADAIDNSNGIPTSATIHSYVVTAYNTLSARIGATVGNVQGDWAETDPSQYSYINNKPDIDALIASYGATSYDNIKDYVDSYVAVSYESLYNDILAITPGDPNVQSNWNETNINSDAYILNKPDIDALIASYGDTLHHSISEEIASYGAVSYESLYNDILAITPGDPNVQSDWNESSSSSDAYIKNKPTLGAASTYAVTNSINNSGTDLPMAKTVYTYVGGSYVSLYNDIIAVKGTIPSVGSAAGKNYTTSVTSGGNDLVTGGAVYTYCGARSGGQVNTVSANQTNVTCPASLSNGQHYTVIYKNTGTSDITVSVSTSYYSPSGSQINITVKGGGYGEINYYKLSDTTFARAV